MMLIAWTPGPWEVILACGCPLFVILPAVVVGIVLLSKKK